MSHYLIDRQDCRVSDLLQRLEKIDKVLERLYTDNRPTLNGDRYMTDSELSRLLKVSRRTLQEYRTEQIIPDYLIHGKLLYKESEIQKLLDDARKECFDERELV